MDTTPRITPRKDGQSSVGDVLRYWGGGYFYNLKLKKNPITNVSIEAEGDVKCTRLFVDGMENADGTRDIGRFNGILTGEFKGLNEPDSGKYSFYGDLAGTADYAFRLKEGIELGIGADEFLSTAYAPPIMLIGSETGVQHAYLDLQRVDASIIDGVLDEKCLPSSVFTELVNVASEADMYSLVLKEQNADGTAIKKSIQKGDSVSIAKPAKTFTYEYKDTNNTIQTITYWYDETGSEVKYWKCVSSSGASGNRTTKEISGCGFIVDPTTNKKSVEFLPDIITLKKWTGVELSTPDATITEGANIFMLSDETKVLTAQEKKVVDATYKNYYSSIKSLYEKYVTSVGEALSFEVVKEKTDDLEKGLKSLAEKIQEDNSINTEIITGWKFDRNSTIEGYTNGIVYSPEPKYESIGGDTFGNDLKPTVKLSVNSSKEYTEYTADGVSVTFGVLKDCKIGSNEPMDILLAKKSGDKDWSVVKTVTNKTIELYDIKDDISADIQGFIETGLILPIVYTSFSNLDSDWEIIQTAYTEYTPSSIEWGKVTNKPNTVAGYNIQDAFTKTQSDSRFVLKSDVPNIDGNALYSSSLGKFSKSTRDIGSTTKPVYINKGTVTASNATVGSKTQPVYMNSGSVTQCEGRVWTEQEIKDLISRISVGVPTGTVISSVSPVPPAGFLACKGALASKTTYANLYALIGNGFGTGTDTQFRLPNYQGVYLRGFGKNADGGNSSADIFTLQKEGLPNITGSIYGYNNFATEAFYFPNPSSTNRNDDGQGSKKYRTDIIFDASRSNPIYGRRTADGSDTGHVTVTNYPVYYYIKY